MENAAQFLREAYVFAAELSGDPSTQNGAILVSASGNVIGRGTNRFPRGVRESPGRCEPPVKYLYIIHAEQDAIAEAARYGHATDSATLYCPWAACVSCAQLIIQAGLKRIVTHAEIHEKTPDRWRELIEKARRMLSEAGVEYLRFEGHLGGLTNRFNGETWSP